MTASTMRQETVRLRLRPLRVEDDAFIHELVNEPAWIDFIGDRGIRNLADARAYIESGPVAMYARMNFGLLAVDLKETGVSVGICGLIKRETWPDVDLGFAFLERYWGHGYAHEAASAVLAHGRAVIGLSRIAAITSPANERSARLLGKLGFRFERTIVLNAGGPESRLWGHGSPAADVT